LICRKADAYRIAPGGNLLLLRLARTYVHAMNCIHYMHDKYFYERLEMALHDKAFSAP
jgi:pyruvate-formate lyase